MGTKPTQVRLSPERLCESAPANFLVSSPISLLRISIYLASLMALEIWLTINFGWAVRILITIAYVILTAPIFGWLFRELREWDEHATFWREWPRAAARQLQPNT